MMPAAATAIALLTLAALTPAVCFALRATRLIRANFRGEPIPVGLGLVPLLWSTGILLALARLLPESRAALVAFAATVGGFGVLGLQDDLFGNREATGLRGHVRKFLVEGEFTTGFIKLAGGAALGIAVPRWLLGWTWIDSLLAGALIALSANALNLLDLRPGRACASFLAGAAVLAVISRSAGTAVPPIMWVAIPALVIYERDARARAMLGDTGSNLLGASLGLAFLLAAPSTALRLAALVLLLGFHAAAERVSLTAIIERTPLLRKLDSLTGVR